MPHENISSNLSPEQARAYMSEGQKVLSDAREKSFKMSDGKVRLEVNPEKDGDGQNTFVLSGVVTGKDGKEYNIHLKNSGAKPYFSGTVDGFTVDKEIARRLYERYSSLTHVRMREGENIEEMVESQLLSGE